MKIVFKKEKAKETIEVCCLFPSYPTNAHVCKSVRKPDNKTLHTGKMKL